MMATGHNATEKLTPEQLKMRFYDHFRNSEALESLRTQLRGKLITEIFKIATPNMSDQDIKNSEELTLLPLQISNWLIYDHLKCMEYEYTLSVFVSEANVKAPDKLLSVKDILSLLGMSEQTTEYKTLLQHYVQNRESFLHILLMTILKKKQTDNNHVMTPSHHLSPQDKHNPPTDNFSISDFHPSKVFNEVRSIASTNKKEPVSVEKTTITQQELHSIKAWYEAEIQRLRQKLIQEVDNIFIQEQTTRLELEQKEAKIVQEEEILNLQKEKVKLKETELKIKSESLISEAEARVKKLKDDLLGKRQEVEKLETEFTDQKLRFEQEKMAFKVEMEENKALQSKLCDLELQCTTLKKNNTVLTIENTDFKNKLKSLEGYKTLEKELTERVKELEDCKRELLITKTEKQEEKIAFLETTKALQQQLVQNIIKIVQETQQPHSLTKSANQEHAQAPPVNVNEGNQYNMLLAKIEEQKSDIKELHRLIHNLHHEKLAPKEMNVKTFPAIKVVHPRPQVLHPQQHDKLYRQQRHVDTGTQFTAEAKHKINQLQKESDAIKQKYSELFHLQPKLFPNIYIPPNDQLVANYINTVELPLVNDGILDDKFHFLDIPNSTSFTASPSEHTSLGHTKYPLSYLPKSSVTKHNPVSEKVEIGFERQEMDSETIHGTSQENIYSFLTQKTCLKKPDIPPPSQKDTTQSGITSNEKNDNVTSKSSNILLSGQTLTPGIQKSNKHVVIPQNENVDVLSSKQYTSTIIDKVGRPENSQEATEDVQQVDMIRKDSSVISSVHRTKDIQTKLNLEESSNDLVVGTQIKGNSKQMYSQSNSNLENNSNDLVIGTQGDNSQQMGISSDSTNQYILKEERKLSIDLDSAWKLASPIKKSADTFIQKTFSSENKFSKLGKQKTDEAEQPQNQANDRTGDVTSKQRTDEVKETKESTNTENDNEIFFTNTEHTHVEPSKENVQEINSIATSTRLEPIKIEDKSVVNTTNTNANKDVDSNQSKEKSSDESNAEKHGESTVSELSELDMSVGSGVEHTSQDEEIW